MSLLFRSSLVSFNASKTYCHSGGMFSLLKVPSLRLKAIDVFFLKEMTSDSCCSSSSFLSLKKFLNLPSRLFYCSFFLAAYRLRRLISSNSCREGQLENIFTRKISPSSLFLNWKARLPRG